MQTQRARLGVFVVGLAVAAGAAIPASAQLRLPVGVLTARAAQYAAVFFDRFSNVVAEETYAQDVTPTLRVAIGRGGLSRAPARRTLKSDFLLVVLPGSNQMTPFRDTFEVDGGAVRDRQQRLASLFLRPSATAMEQARAIADESARYNIGNLQRTVNDPVLALSFLQADRQDHLTFKIDKADADAGPDVWIVEYQEHARPTFVRGPFDRDMPVHGRFWIESTTGRVVRTEFVIQDPGVTARVTTSFRADDRFEVNVPAEMLEDYTLANARVSGRATYGRFRQFGVNTDEKPNDEAPKP